MTEGRGQRIEGAKVKSWEDGRQWVELVWLESLEDGKLESLNTDWLKSLEARKMWSWEGKKIFHTVLGGMTHDSQPALNAHVNQPINSINRSTKSSQLTQSICSLNFLKFYDNRQPLDLGTLNL
jgi:hypothetical protein